MAEAQNEPVTYGEYEIEKLLGKGSIGKVYLARHRRIGRHVALKIIRPEQRFDDEADREEFRRRLQREAELCASLHHPNVVTLFEAGYEDDVIAYLATEYVEGESLQARLKKTRPLPLDDALRIAADVLRALDYLRDAGVAPDERTAEAIGIVESKRDADGRWPLEHAHHDELLVDLDEAEGRPSRWITLRALRVLRWADGDERSSAASQAST